MRHKQTKNNKTKAWLRSPFMPSGQETDPTYSMAPWAYMEHQYINTTPPYAPRSSRFGSEPPSVEDNVDVWRYAILFAELHTRNDDIRAINYSHAM